MTLPPLRSVLLGLLLLGPGLALAGGSEPAAAPDHPAEAAHAPPAPKPLPAEAAHAIPAPKPLPAAPVVPVVAEAPGGAAGRPPTPGNDTQQFCSNVAAAAADARFAWQRKQLTDLQGQLKQRIAELDAKQAEVQAVITRRDDMIRKATETVVGIYSHMKPDAAASQLAALDDEMAAAILAQLTQKQASTILNEIPSEKAAHLVTAIATVQQARKS